MCGRRAAGGTSAGGTSGGARPAGCQIGGVPRIHPVVDPEPANDDTPLRHLLWAALGPAIGLPLVAWAAIGDRWVLAAGTALLVAVHVGSARRVGCMRAELVRLRADSASQARYLEWGASHDDLTGLPNRAGLHDAIARRLVAHGDVSAMFVDLDHFKRVNDEHGHLAGDDVLRVVARRLRSTFRPDDVVTRPGGDEFLVLLASPPGAAELQRLAERVIEALERPIAVGEVMVRISASIGTTTVAGGDADLDRLIVDCDRALYRAKRSGRGRAVSAVDLPPGPA